MPKVVICVVSGWAAGGGHSLHVVCDLSLASAEHARFKQTDTDGSLLRRRVWVRLPRQAGRPEVRPRGLPSRSDVTAAEMHSDGSRQRGRRLTPSWSRTALQWAGEINGKSPMAQRMIKFAFNLIDDGLVGQQLFAGEATRLAYGTDEAVEGRDAFLEKRQPEWSSFPWHY